MDYADLVSAYEKQLDENIKIFLQLEKKESAGLRFQYEMGVEQARTMEAAISLLDLQRETVKDVPRMENFKQVSSFKAKHFCVYIRERDGYRCGQPVKGENELCRHHKQNKNPI